MGTVTLRLAPRPAHVRTARLVASAMARRGGVAEDLLDDVRLAVGEACARAVRLHERHGMDDTVTLELVDGDTFTVVVADSVAGDTDGQPASLLAGPAAGPRHIDGQAVAARTAPTDKTCSVLTHSAVGVADERWAESERLALAVLAGVVDDLRVERGSGGTRVHMRWPAGG